MFYYCCCPSCSHIYVDDSGENPLVVKKETDKSLLYLTVFCLICINFYLIIIGTITLKTVFAKVGIKLGELLNEKEGLQQDVRSRTMYVLLHTYMFMFTHIRCCCQVKTTTQSIK